MSLTKRQRTALDAEIEFIEEIRGGPVLAYWNDHAGLSNRPLCREFQDAEQIHCHNCPVMMHTGQHNCRGWDYLTFCERWRNLVLTAWASEADRHEAELVWREECDGYLNMLREIKDHE